jgi:rare lipoprotein A
MRRRAPNGPLTLFCYTATKLMRASPCGRPHVNAEAGNVGCRVRTLARLGCATVLATLAAACAQRSAPLPFAPIAAAPQCVPFVQQGVASWYGPTHHGRQTASGARFDMNGLTAAHRTLPLGTEIEVENLDNGKKVGVTVNDRGPYARGRILDLSRAAAQRLGFSHDGTAQVRLTATSDCREAKAVPVPPSQAPVASR